MFSEASAAVQKRFVPTRAQVGETRQAVNQNCGLTQRTLVGDGYMRFDCQPVGYHPAAAGLTPDQRQALENYQSCSVVKVQPVQPALVQRQCLEGATDISEGLEVVETPEGRVMRPVVKTSAFVQPLPITSASARYPFNPYVPLSPGVQLPEVKGGAGDDQEQPIWQVGGGVARLTCGFPTHFNERDGQITHTCQRVAGTNGRCEEHATSELVGGAASRSSMLYYPVYDPARIEMKTAGGLEEDLAATGSYATPMSYQELAQQGLVAGGETPEVGGVEPDGMVLQGAVQAERLPGRSELQSLMLGAGPEGEGLHLVQPNETQALEAFETARKALGKKEAPYWYIYEAGTYGDGRESSLGREKGFPFSDKDRQESELALSEAAVDQEKAREEAAYMLALAQVINRLNNLWYQYSSKVIDARYDTIRTLEAHVLAVIANLEHGKGERDKGGVIWFRKNYGSNADSKQGLLDGLVRFADRTSSNGEDLMHAVLKYYVTHARVPNATQKVWVPHAGLRRYQRADGPRQSAYASVLGAVVQNLTSQRMPPMRVLGGETEVLVMNPALEPEPQNLGSPTLVPPENLNVIGVLEAAVLALLSRAQYKYYLAWNTKWFVPDTTSFAFAASGSAPLPTELAALVTGHFGKYVNKSLAEYLTLYQLSSASALGVDFMRLNKFALSRAKALGLALPAPGEFPMTLSRVAQEGRVVSPASPAGQATLLGINPLGAEGERLEAAAAPVMSVVGPGGESLGLRLGQPRRVDGSRTLGVDDSEFAFGPPLYADVGRSAEFGGRQAGQAGQAGVRKSAPARAPAASRVRARAAAPAPVRKGGKVRVPVSTTKRTKSGVSYNVPALVRTTVSTRPRLGGCAPCEKMARASRSAGARKESTDDL